MQTKMFLSGAALDSAIRSITNSRNPRCAVAFLGNGAADLFRGGKAQIVCNLFSGSTNPSAVRVLQDQGHEVRQNDRLHAKVYTGDGRALTSSANLSANGLGFQDGELAHWIEAGSYTNDVDEVEVWFDKLWNDPTTKGISESDLRAATKLWNQRRSSKPTLSFLDFDARAPDMPLITYYRDVDYKTNPAHMPETAGSVNPEWLTHFYIVEGESDHTLLAPGRWLLWWKLNKNGQPSKQTTCFWFRAGPLWRNLIKVKGGKEWSDVIIDQSDGVPAPFDCTEPTFNKVFRETIMRPEYQPLRSENYSGSFLYNGFEKMRDIWPALHDAYIREKARTS